MTKTRFCVYLVLSLLIHALVFRTVPPTVLTTPPTSPLNTESDKALAEKKERETTSKFLELELLRQRIVEHLQDARKDYNQTKDANAESTKDVPEASPDLPPTPPDELMAAPDFAVGTPEETTETLEAYANKFQALREEIGLTRIATQQKIPIEQVRKNLGAPPPPPPTAPLPTNPFTAAENDQKLAQLKQQVEKMLDELEQTKLQGATITFESHADAEAKMRDLAADKGDNVGSKDFSGLMQQKASSGSPAPSSPSENNDPAGGKKGNTPGSGQSSSSGPGGNPGPNRGLGNGQGNLRGTTVGNTTLGLRNNGQSPGGHSWDNAGLSTSTPYDIPDSSIQLLPNATDLPPPIDLHFPTGTGARHYGSEGIKAGWTYFSSWYWVGPFPNPERRNLETRFPPELGVNLDATYVTESGEKLRWKFYTQDSFVTLPPQIAFAIFYYYTEVTFETATDRWLAIGSDDASTLWLNDTIVWVSGKQLKPMKINEGFRKVHFNAGCNRLLFRLENGRGTQTLFSLLLDARPAQ